jgi:imidazolonepropionase-like amidohydrolase
MKDPSVAGVTRRLGEGRREGERRGDVHRDGAGDRGDVLRVERAHRLEEAGVVHEQRQLGAASEPRERVALQPARERGRVGEVEPHLSERVAVAAREAGVSVSRDAEHASAVREQVRGGADIIKIATTGGIDPSFLVTQASMADVELEAVIHTAHDLGRRVTAHNNVLPGQRPIGIERAVRAGIDAIDHGYYLDDDIIERMAEARTWWIVTSSYLKIVAEQGPEAGLSQIYVDKARAALESVFDSIPRARSAGVRIASGSDLLGTPVDPHGLNAMELVLLREAGFSDREVIDIVTGTNAEMLGINHFTGSIETGKSADLLLVAGQPDEDVSVLTDPDRIKLVMVEGRVMKDELTEAAGAR